MTKLYGSMDFLNINLSDDTKLATHVEEPKTSSLDFLNEIINPTRIEVGENEVKNAHFIKRVEDEVDDLGAVKTFNRFGNTVRYYDLTQDQMMLVGMRESKAVRKIVLAKLKEYKKALVAITEADSLDEAKSIAHNSLSKCREFLRANHHVTCQIIDDSELDAEWGDVQFFQLICKATFGCTPKYFRIKNNIPDSQPIRDWMVENDEGLLFTYNANLTEATTLLRLGRDYAQLTEWFANKS